MEKHEFVSPAWIEMARVQITQVLAAMNLRDVCYTLCEEFTNPPEHLRRGDAATIGFYVRVADSRVEVGDHPIDDADLKIVSDYEDALLVAREPEAPVAEQKMLEERMAAGRLKIMGNPLDMPAILRDLDIHKLLASRTA
jgi:hypothetical protein